MYSPIEQANRNPPRHLAAQRDVLQAEQAQLREGLDRVLAQIHALEPDVNHNEATLAEIMQNSVFPDSYREFAEDTKNQRRQLEALNGYREDARAKFSEVTKQLAEIERQILGE